LFLFWECRNGSHKSESLPSDFFSIYIRIKLGYKSPKKLYFVWEALESIWSVKIWNKNKKWETSILFFFINDLLSSAFLFQKCWSDCQNIISALQTTITVSFLFLFFSRNHFKVTDVLFNVETVQCQSLLNFEIKKPIKLISLDSIAKIESI
jgi:hypothetical protein